VAQQLTWLTNSLRLVARASVAVSLVTCRHSSSYILFPQLYLPMLGYLIRRLAPVSSSSAARRSSTSEQPQDTSACSSNQRFPWEGTYSMNEGSQPPNACRHVAQCTTQLVGKFAREFDGRWYMKSYHKLILHVSSPIAAWQHSQGGNSCLLLLLLLNQGFTQGECGWADPCLHHHKGSIMYILPHKQYGSASTMVYCLSSDEEGACKQRPGFGNTARGQRC